MMNRFIYFLSFFVLFLLPLKAEDRVLFTLDGKDVFLSEFLYFYDAARTSCNVTVDEYFQNFLRCKMKIADARKRGLGECDGFNDRVESVKYSLIKNLSHVDSVYGFVKIGMFTYKLPQKSNVECMRKADVVMAEVYNNLIDGMSVQDIISINKDSALVFDDFGNTWQNRTFILDEIDSEIEKLSVGDISRPVYSPEGKHIIVLNDKNDMPVCGVDDDFIFKHMEEALLLLEWDKNTILPYMDYTDDDLHKFFKKNKKHYRWELPHYKGAVIQGDSKKTVSKLKRKLRKQPLEKWNDISERFCEEYGVKLKCDVGLFVIGKNKFVDKLVFKCGEFGKVEGFSYTTVVGKCLDYEPEEFMDVYDEVVKDYIEEAENRYFDDLERKFKVEKHLDVLKTVNCSVSN